MGSSSPCPITVQLGPNRDATITPHLYTGVLPAIEGKYRELNSLGAFQLGGFLTYGTIDECRSDATLEPQQGLPRLFRRQRPVAARSRCGASPARSASRRDKTVTRRYDITNDDRLRNRHQSRADHARQLHLDRRLGVPGAARRRSIKSTFRLPCRQSTRASGWARSPAARSRSRPTASSILRIEGQDTQRAFASAQWDLRRLTPWGQEVMLTAYGRGDVYHTDDAASTTVPIYRGTDGWHARGDRRAGRRHQMAVHRPASGRHAAARAASAVGRSRRRPRTSTFPTRMRARSTLRTATCSRSTASPATTAGRISRA